VNWNEMLVVFRKELKDLLRDRRTLFGMFFFPLVLFPILTVGFGTVEKKTRAKVEQERFPVMLLHAEQAPALAEKLRASRNLLILPEAADFAARINEKQLRAAVEFPPDFEKQILGGGRPKLRIHYFAAEIRSENAVDKIEDVVNAYRKDVLDARMAAAHLPAAALTPIETKRESVAAPEKVAGSKLALILPYMIILLCLTGAMHPAMDLTAGEKERGTMETLLASAVGRREIVAGKFLVVLCVSLTTTVMSMLSYLTTMFFAKDYAQDMFRGKSYSLGIDAALTILLLVLPLAIFFAATLLAMSIAAKSYKEAQQQIGSLMIFAFLPAIVGMIPGIELTPKTAVIPILNVSLVAKEIFTGNLPWPMIGMVFLATCVYAAFALNAALSRFQNESVMFRG